jgi:hypothetical protein
VDVAHAALRQSLIGMASSRQQLAPRSRVCAARLRSEAGCTSPAAAPCQLAVLRWKRRFRRTRRRPVAVSQARRLISSSDRK